MCRNVRVIVSVSSANSCSMSCFYTLCMNPSGFRHVFLKLSQLPVAWSAALLFGPQLLRSIWKNWHFQMLLQITTALKWFMPLFIRSTMFCLTFTRFVVQIVCLRVPTSENKRNAAFPTNLTSQNGRHAGPHVRSGVVFQIFSAEVLAARWS